MIEINGTKITIVKGDITKLQVDAIVNAANTRLLGGGGVDGAIHRAGGREILEECKKIGGCPRGEARITTAGKMPSKKVIHTVGPIYRGGEEGEAQLLYNAYYNSLKLAEENHLSTIAFPSISTGIYGYPIEEASHIAIKAVVDFIKGKNTMEEVIFVLFSQKDYDIYQKKVEIVAQEIEQIK